jgi:hypothetical protein
MSEGKPVAEVPVHPRHGRLWANVRPIGAETPMPNYPRDALYDDQAMAANAALLLAQIHFMRLTEEGAKMAFGHVVQQKRDLEAECQKLRRLLSLAYEDIRRLTRAELTTPPEKKKGTP